MAHCCCQGGLPTLLLLLLLVLLLLLLGLVSKPNPQPLLRCCWLAAPSLSSSCSSH
jgi:hypothetical protein